MEFFSDYLNFFLWLTLSVIIGSVGYQWLKWSRAFNYWKSRNVIHPKPLPFFGNRLPLLIRSPSDVEMEWYRTYGKVYGLYFAEKPELTVAEPQLIKQIMVRDFHIFRNRRGTPGGPSVLSSNLIKARDDTWKRVRAIASPTFTSGKLKKMYSLINKCCNDFLQDLEEKIEKEKEIDMKKTMGNLTMDVIARCAFATNVNTYKDPNNEFIRRMYPIFNIPNWTFISSMILPKFIFLFTPFAKPLIDFFRNAMFYAKFGAKVVKHRKDNKEKHNDFLQLLMDAERTDGQTRDENDANEAHHVNEGADELKADKEALRDVIEKKLTEDEILAQCFAFIIAGYETTATTLSFCAYELSLNSEIQDRLYQETKDAFDESGEIPYDVLSKLPFLDAVISETLRSYPPIFRMEREAMDSVMLGNTGIKVEKGVVIEIPTYAIHHDPENFPDPFTFKPERFLPENRDKIKPYTYLPFGTGPRNCVGMRFALLEAKLALAKLSQKFKFTRVANTDVPIVFIEGRKLMQARRIIVGMEKR